MSASSEDSGFSDDGFSGNEEAQEAKEAREAHHDRKAPRISPAKPDVDVMQLQAEEEAKRVVAGKEGSRGRASSAVDAPSAASSAKRNRVFFVLFAVLVIFLLLVWFRKKPTTAITASTAMRGREAVVASDASSLPPPLSLPAAVADSIKPTPKPLHHHDPLFQRIRR